ncbi:MAG: TIGR03905 family TSCPD domain-containing protein [Tenericutes bacterium]|nr:TIGR03905 family TSCPD domain-containing protein [Mycoplasmatota bacterium]
MKYTYNTKGTCSTKIDYEIEDNKIHNVTFTNGCNGNLKAISRLVEGEDVDKVIDRLKGVTCGFRETSCGDQFARALEESKNK